MLNATPRNRLLVACGLVLFALGAHAQSFRVQCPQTTTQHPGGIGNDVAGMPSSSTVATTATSTIKCQQVAGGDGYATMGDGQPIYLFGFGPLSGLSDIYKGLPGTEPYSIFDTTFGPNNTTGDTGTPSNMVGLPNNSNTWNGAVGLTADINVDPWTSGNTYVVGAAVRTATGVYTAVTAGTAGTSPPKCTT